MKRLVTFTALAFFALHSQAQTNSFPTTGKVGIGTTTPATLLTVSGGPISIQSTSGQYTLANIDNFSTSPLGSSHLMSLYSGDLMLRSNWGVSVDLNNGSLGDNAGATQSRILSTSSFTINSRSSATAFSTLFVVRNNGNVLIGQTSQTNTGYKLDVNGNVRANKIVVNTTGADYVFAPRYALPSLPFLATYIQRNHHLPEIASAAAMQAQGLDLGQNETKLLQKVEELTLYVIHEDQRNQQNERLLVRQQKALSLLQRQLNALTGKASHTKEVASGH